MIIWFLKRFILGLVVAALVWGLYRMITIQPPQPKPYYATLPQPAVLAHRGGKGLWPENTLEAFRNAWAMGADVLEMDVHGTRDGAIVVIHDATVDRTTDGSGAVKEMTLAQVQALDAGYRFTLDNGQTYPYRGKGVRIPTLEEVFDALPDARFNIEIKSNDPPIVDTLAGLIERKGVQDQVVVGSFSHETVQAFRRRMHGVPTFGSESEIRSFWIYQMLRVPRIWRPVADTLQVPLTYKVSGRRVAVLTSRFVRSAHSLGVRVDAWTINDPDEMARLLDMNVDGIITDYPDRLLDLLQARGLR